MTDKRRALGALTRADLLEVGRALEVDVAARMSLDELRDAVAKSKRASLDKILALLSRDILKLICEALGLPADGREKQPIIDRILGRSDEDGDDSDDNAGDNGRSYAEPPEPAPAPPAQAWLAFPEVAPSAPKPIQQATPPPPPAPTPAAATDWMLALEVEPRKPRLAWQGMWRKELATAVPTQVVEIVRPGRAMDRGELAGLATRQVEARDTTTLPPNRLIWTNDNLVALQTLLEERDPQTHEYRYRGKVDLVYIDPPFMVNNDFRADNAIDLDLDEEVQAKKEPSLVEILAYRDTWRQGLDSFLSMLRRRLELLKQLLAPTGSIYVHLDWHAVHYVKVLMDEIFGYETFRNEIVWKRSSAHSDTSQGASHMGRSTDTILFYSGEAASLTPLYSPYDPNYIAENYKRKDPDGRIYRIDNIQGPGGAAKGNPFYEFLGVERYWRYSQERMGELYRQGRIIQTKPGAVPQYKRYLDEMPGVPLQNLWDDVPFINNRSDEALGYPTQKPLHLLERIIQASSGPNGLVLDCFAGSGTTCEAAERLGRRWIGIDNAKYGIHLSRKRMIQLHGQPRPPAHSKYHYLPCEACDTTTRKELPQRSPGLFMVQPFTIENMGVYQRAEHWQDFQTQRSRYRDEMIKVFGGEVVPHSALLHGRKGNSWVHVGPLDGPVSVGQIWNIAREAQRTNCKAVTVLSADFDTLSASEKQEVEQKTGVKVQIRVIPASALDEVKRRLDYQRSNPDAPVESMAIPAFYAPLSIVLAAKVSARTVQLKLERCEVDIESFLASQRPASAQKPLTDGMTPTARKKVQAERDKWGDRERVLEKWLAKATTWQKFIDFWSVDWDYGRRVSPDGKPIFETDWQSFRTRAKGEIAPLVFVADFKYRESGHYRIAARVTDVFGNDGIATVTVEVK